MGRSHTWPPRSPWRSGRSPSSAGPCFATRLGLHVLSPSRRAHVHRHAHQVSHAADRTDTTPQRCSLVSPAGSPIVSPPKAIEGEPFTQPARSSRLDGTPTPGTTLAVGLHVRGFFLGPALHPPSRTVPVVRVTIDGGGPYRIRIAQVLDSESPRFDPMSKEPESLSRAGCPPMNSHNDQPRSKP